MRSNARISGPLLDRIDIHMEVPRVAYDNLAPAMHGEPSGAIRAREFCAPLVCTV